MKLVSFGPRGREKPGVVVGNDIIDLTAADRSLPSTVRGILTADLLDVVAGLASSAASVPGECKHDVQKVRLGPPVTDPSKIICLGLNYKDHAEEQDRKVPEVPLLFGKGPNVLAGDGDPMPYPHTVEQLDYEIELAFVMGKRARRVSIEDAPRYIAGFGVFMDITARDFQRRERQWLRAKSVDGSGPFGPYLVTADDVPDPYGLDISIDVNGETLQSSNTGQMFFKVDYLVHFMSQTMTLEPGDVVATGTPSGVGVFRHPPRYLEPGDEIVGRIDRLGTLRCTIGPQD
jgi:2-keto-4-pentenoate hydratase/2-oxohepta-3-ene-1,7-dioic acid hydratase in catechol pathway